MTSRGHTRLVSKKVEEYITKTFGAHVVAHPYSYSEIMGGNHHLRGQIKELVVLFSTSGAGSLSGHVVGRFHPTDAGRASAEECARAINSSINLLKQHQIDIYQKGLGIHNPKESRKEE